MPELPPGSVTEEAYRDQQGSVLVKKVGRSAGGKVVRTQEVSVEGSPPQGLAVRDGDAVSRVTKRTPVRSQGHRREVGVSLRPRQEVPGPGPWSWLQVLGLGPRWMDGWMDGRMGGCRMDGRTEDGWRM